MNRQMKWIFSALLLVVFIHPLHGQDSQTLISELMSSPPGSFVVVDGGIPQERELQPSLEQNSQLPSWRNFQLPPWRNFQLPPWQDLRAAALAWEPADSPDRNVWLRDTLLCDDGVYRHFHYRLPADYSTRKPAPLLLYLHGGVSRDELPDSGGESDFPEGYMTTWATDEGYIIVVPSAQNGATWWDATGSHYLLSILRNLKSSLNIDDGKVFVSGFSDGGSGSWFLAQFYPTDFAAFLPHAGHPGCDNWGTPPRQAYFRNLRNRPVYAVNNGKDGLYPAANIQDMLLPSVAAEANLTYRIYPDYPHRPQFWDEEKANFGSFLKRTQRNPHPTRITLEAADPMRCDWLEIQEIDTLHAFPGSWDDFNARTKRERVVVGFMPDSEADASGCLVKSVGDNAEYPASRIGLEAGDLIVGLGKEKIRSYDDFKEAISAYHCGDDFKMIVKRDGKKLEMTDQFNPAQYGWLHDRSRPSMILEAAILANRIDLQASRAGKISLFVDPHLIDLEQPLRVYLDDHEIYKGTVQANPALMMRLLDRGRDPERMYVARIDLDLNALRTW